MEHNNKKIILILLMLLSAAASTALSYLYYFDNDLFHLITNPVVNYTKSLFSFNKKDSELGALNLVTEFDEITGESYIELSDNVKVILAKNKSINNDFVGNLYFESGLINVPVVQAKTIYDKEGELRTFYDRKGKVQAFNEKLTGNDVYIYMDWKTGKYDLTNKGGSIFMDYRNDIEKDQNIIVYGHHFAGANETSKNRTKAFTQLDSFLNSKNNVDNININLILQNEVRFYKIVCVYVFDMYDYEDTQYYRTNYDIDYLTEKPDPGYYETYIDAIMERAVYKSGEKLLPSDNTLTLQTCISNDVDDSRKEIVVCKEVNRVKLK